MLIGDLRSRIKDTRTCVRALGIAVVDTTVRRAVAEVTHGHLIVEVSGGGGTKSVDLSLTDERYSTIGRLHGQLSRVSGYQCLIDEDADTEHVSIDISEVGPVDVGPGCSAIELLTHLFSDIELETVLRDAIQRHNPSFSLDSVPPTETSFVLTLAQAEICMRQAYDVSKRRGLDTDVNNLLAIARDLQSRYDQDVQRLRRALASPKEATPNLMGEGDVVIGSCFGRSLRTGFQAPMSQNLPPAEPVIQTPDVRDEEDTNVRVRWVRNRDYDFYSSELWMDTTPDVVRTREDALFGVPFSSRDVSVSRHSAVERPTSSRMVFRSYGANSNFDTVGFATFVEEWGQMISSVVVGGLEPETDYYFRLFIIDLNYESVGSDVVKFRTKPIRAAFRVDGNPPVAPSYGAAGTVGRFHLDPLKAALTAAHKFRLGDKEVSFTVISSTIGEFTVPTYVQKGDKQCVIQSPTGLFDVKSSAFNVV